LSKIESKEIKWILEAKPNSLTDHFLCDVKVDEPYQTWKISISNVKAENLVRETLDWEFANHLVTRKVFKVKPEEIVAHRRQIESRKDEGLFVLWLMKQKSIIKQIFKEDLKVRNFLKEGVTVDFTYD